MLPSPWPVPRNRRCGQSSAAAAVAVCEGVFHVASPVPSSRSTNHEAEVIAPAVTGTLNVLKACYEAKVKRVVMVSSVAAVSVNPNWPNDKAFNEDSWSDEDICRKHQDWYYLSETLAQHEAFAYAAKTGLDIVTICPSLVIGPLMQSTVHTKKINRLRVGRLNNLVYVQLNARLLKKTKKRNVNNKDVLLAIDAYHAQGWIIDGADDEDIDPVLGLSFRLIDEASGATEATKPH
ncbi:hypothetical protein GUJ93_ZPchr0012g21307 [Zizania palustris]|uniref:NAD-dependent epimerase/dehydratase domain-containing protein n=1 Tax=Zizania palustris TaxID=103762 RepID=A0A8J5WUI9_ZIZPA|nr:hypothetical protein GUJ93_ZPchr0012g21307 [Zizania palustris]